MSQGYGLDLYGTAFYGYSQPADYSVSPFTAMQTDYGKISLLWSSPNSTPWKYLKLTRSSSGYPATPKDGLDLLDITSSTMVRTYDDVVDVVEGTIYYYTMFIAVDAPAYSGSATYLENSQVFYNGQYWGSIQNGNTGNTPSVGSAWWQSSTFIPVWYPAGYTATMALSNQGYGTRLYQKTPQPYKIDTSDTFSDTSIDNPSLQHYLNVFGFGLDLLKNSYDSFLNLNDPSRISAYDLDLLGQQFGLTTDYLSTPSQRRQRLANVSVNYQIKGRAQSIHNLIADLSGWDCDVEYGPNILPSADSAAFVHPSYSVWSAFTLYKSGQNIQYNGYNYTCATTQAYGTAQAPTGTGSSNTWWTLQYQVLNTSANLNPGTRMQSTWSLSSTTVTASITGVVTGVAHPTDSTVNNWNALEIVQTNNFGAGSVDLFSITDLATSSWSNSANYVIGNYVTYTDGYTYIARKPSGPGTPYGFTAPSLNNQFWQAVYYKSGDLPGRYTDTAPLGGTAVWSSTVSYSSGDRVSFNGNVYRCAVSNKNQSPSLGYYSSQYWTYLYTSQTTYVLSTYGAHVNYGSFFGVFVGITPRFYSANGVLLNNTASNLSGYQISEFAFTTRFSNDYADLSGTSEASTLNAVNNYMLGTGLWQSVPATANMWSSSFGMASVNQALAGTSTYTFLLLSQTLPLSHTITLGQGRYCLTFANDYMNTAHKTHGLVFGYKDTGNFYYVTRTSLRQVSAGVDTVLGSWTRLQTGDRIVVDVTANICVYKYARTGDGALQILANSIGTGPTSLTLACYTGLIQKYSSTGDL